MTWPERTVCRILLLVAQIVAGTNSVLHQRLVELSNEITVNGKPAPPAQVHDHPLAH